LDAENYTQPSQPISYPCVDSKARDGFVQRFSAGQAGRAQRAPSGASASVLVALAALAYIASRTSALLERERLIGSALLERERLIGSADLEARIVGWGRGGHGEGGEAGKDADDLHVC
jgi:hypothetical protein